VGLRSDSAAGPVTSPPVWTNQKQEAVGMWRLRTEVQLHLRSLTNQQTVNFHLDCSDDLQCSSQPITDQHRSMVMKDESIQRTPEALDRAPTAIGQRPPSRHELSTQGPGSEGYPTHPTPQTDNQSRP